MIHFRKNFYSQCRPRCISTTYEAEVKRYPMEESALRKYSFPEGYDLAVAEISKIKPIEIRVKNTGKVTLKQDKRIICF